MGLVIGALFFLLIIIANVIGGVKLALIVGFTLLIFYSVIILIINVVARRNDRLANVRLDQKIQKLRPLPEWVKAEMEDIQVKIAKLYNEKRPLDKKGKGRSTEETLRLAEIIDEIEALTAQRKTLIEDNSQEDNSQ